MCLKLMPVPGRGVCGFVYAVPDFVGYNSGLSCLNFHFSLDVDMGGAPKSRPPDGWGESAETAEDKHRRLRESLLLLVEFWCTVQG